MTRRLIVYVDGSQVIGPQRRAQAQGWGLVALHDDQHHERRGHFLGGKVSPLHGRHEHLAFVQAVLYARDQGFDPRQVSIYCDDDVFGYAAWSTHPGNFQGQKAEIVMQRLRGVAQHAFDASIIEPVLQTFFHSHIVKLRGHRQEVYQERVDYLAKFSARQALGLEEPDAAPMDMQTWLEQGLEIYPRMPVEEAVETGVEADGQVAEVEPVIWRAPFVRP